MTSRTHERVQTQSERADREGRNEILSQATVLVVCAPPSFVFETFDWEILPRGVGATCVLPSSPKYDERFYHVSIYSRSLYSETLITRYASGETVLLCGLKRGRWRWFQWGPCGTSCLLYTSDAADE